MTKSLSFEWKDILKQNVKMEQGVVIWHKATNSLVVKKFCEQNYGAQIAIKWFFLVEVSFVEP